MAAGIGEVAISKLADVIYDKAGNWIQRKFEKKQIYDAVKNYFDKWFKENEMVTRKEELDFGGLEEYIKGDLIDELFDCCIIQEINIRNEKYRQILEKGFQYAHADNTLKEYKVCFFVDKVKSIVQAIAENNVDNNVLILINRAVDSVQESREIIAKTEYQKQSTLEESVKRIKNNIKNQPLISSVPGRMSFGALFNSVDRKKQLYTDQTISLKNSDVTYSSIYQLFNERKEQNLLISGAAGSGKSTGLKSLFLTNTSNTDVYYATIKDYNDSRKEAEMLKYIRMIIKGEISPTGKLIILDGLDEAYADDQSGAIKFVNLLFLSKGHVWIGCRADYYDRICVSLDNNFEDVAVIKPWSLAARNDYITRYSKFINDDQFKDIAISLLSKKPDDYFISTNPFFLTLFLYAIDKKDMSIVPRNEYELLELFLERWIEAERNRGSSTLTEEEFFIQLYNLADSIYTGGNPDAKTADSSVLGLVVINRTKIKAFIHWDFCVFLIAKQIINATLEGDLALVSYYPKAFLDDVTNMTLDQFNNCIPAEIEKMGANLSDVYRQIYELEKSILSQVARERLRSMSNLEILKLKDEIIYFILRLPLFNKESFFSYASEPDRIDHPILRLGLAYGIGMTMSHPFALQFAKELIPGTSVDLLNRSWTVAYFGDQKTLNIYDFKENPVSSWDMARKVRLDRFQKNKEKAYRFRIFDIPLLYCFYESRHWMGCISAEDLEIIKNCDIDWPYYSEEEKEFLKTAKKKLVDEYTFFLDCNNRFA